MNTPPFSTELHNRRPLAFWLLICCALIFAMVVLGGVTRLTGSGLSMVKWEPLIGIIPPLTHEEWEHTFQLYQQFPEYQLKNSHFTLEEFKSIFWVEYAHRVLGRLIGLVFFLPLVYFALRGQIDKLLTKKLLVAFLLGGLQGLMGWYMVKSGLVDQPHVSQYRLTAHLGLALLIYGYLFWIALDLLRPTSSPQMMKKSLRRVRNFSFIVTCFIFVTALAGGFVAGLKAGYAYNTFPLMDGRFFPEGLFALSPWWRNLFEDITTVQFDHRLLATVVFGMVVTLWWVGRTETLSYRTRWAFHWLLVIMLIQVTLGIATLLLFVPIWLAAFHQGGAVALLTVALWVNHELVTNSH